jgi:hypothetical protein
LETFEVVLLISSRILFSKILIGKLSKRAGWSVKFASMTTHLCLTHFHQKCPLQFESEGASDIQHYGQVRRLQRPNRTLQINVFVQYEESDLEFPSNELSPSQQAAFEGF